MQKADELYPPENTMKRWIFFEEEIFAHCNAWCSNYYKNRNRTRQFPKTKIKTADSFCLMKKRQSNKQRKRVRRVTHRTGRVLPPNEEIEEESDRRANSRVEDSRLEGSPFPQLPFQALVHPTRIITTENTAGKKKPA